MQTLYSSLAGYIAKNKYPFHMPGHKGNAAFLPPVALQKLDLTELAGLDNLHQPTTCIKATQRHIANIYGADESFLLVNGATAGITAAIIATCTENTTVAIDRNCHRSVYSGLVLSGAKPVYFLPQAQEPPAASVTIVTSPTYEGNVLNISQIAKKSQLLIVDEAHGAHFAFSNVFPKSAMYQGADIVVHSFHKTLPAFSQSASLHVKGAKISPASLQQALALVQTSSPSYMIMSTTDYMLNLLCDNSHYFDRYTENLLKLRENLADWLIPNDDIGKLLLNIPKDEKWLTESGLAFEMITENYTLAMTSVADKKEGFELLKKAVDKIDPTKKPALPQKGKTAKIMPPLPNVILTPRQTLHKKSRSTWLTESIGKISATFLAPVPPGIPILAPGEEISREIVEFYVSEYGDCGVDVVL